MPLTVCLQFLGTVPATAQAQLSALIQEAGIATCTDVQQPLEFGVAIFERVDADVLDQLRAISRDSTVIAVCICRQGLRTAAMWSVLDAGATDLLSWARLPARADDILHRLQRWQAARELAGSAAVRSMLAGQSPVWRRLLQEVAEVAGFSQASVLITGETGTGKEQIAHLIHQLDGRKEIGNFVVLDCTTVSPELSGSEFFGHERGAFTGAANLREGAFALAHRGTLFLDEVGELPPTLQAQLLRVVQERQYKRLGSNSWQRSEFRLVCATHRDLEAAIAEGSFRADLYYRIAGWRCRMPPLRERREDILPLAAFFLRQLDPQAESVDIDVAVREWLLTREYPGNVRDLRQVVARLWHRHSGGTITIGDVPESERPSGAAVHQRWPDPRFADSLRDALRLGVGLKEIGQAATDLAMQIALEQEAGNLQRAARRLGVTDRALQIRRANQRAHH